MSQAVRPDLLRVTNDSQRLESTFGADRHRVSLVTQNIPENHVFNTFLVIFPRDIQRHVFLRPQGIRLFLDPGQLTGGKFPGIRQCSVNLKPHFLAQVLDTVRGI